MRCSGQPKISCELVGQHVRLTSVNPSQIFIVLRLELFYHWLIGCGKTKTVKYVISELMSHVEV